MTFTVWVLLIMLSGDPRYNPNGITIIDNIATQAECQRITSYINNVSSHNYSTGRCIEVWKKTN